MSGADPKRPQPVSVEDWDEEAQASVPGTRATANANVAVKRDLSNDSGPQSLSHLVRNKYDGTDSGYASKAPTVSSMASSTRRGNSGLKVDTAVQIERERNPYAMTATPRDSSDPKTAASLQKEKLAKEKPKPVKKPFCHKAGICWVCDKYGFHFDPRDPPKDLHNRDTSKPAAPAPKATTTQPPKPGVAKAKVEETQRPPPRRLSSNQARPTSMYAGTPIQTGPYPQYPAMHSGWATVTPPPGVVYSQYPYMAPATPGSYMPPQTPTYYTQELPSAFDDYPQPQPKARRPSVLGQERRLSVLSQERPRLEKRPSKTNNTVEKIASRDQRPPAVSHNSNRSIDADKAAMPPPPKPPHATTAQTARPRPHRASTYHENTRTNQRPPYDESESESDDEIDPRMMGGFRQPPASPRRPPSSYKPPTQEVPERPQAVQKAQSYQEGSNRVHVATSNHTIPRRRTTDSAPPAHSTDAQEAAAEAYMRKRGSMPVVDLTAENLKVLKNVAVRPVSDQRSESGSTASHVTHQSSSKDSSSGRGRMVSASSGAGHSRGTSMSININGLNLNITDGGAVHGDGPPVLLDVGGVQISMNNRDKENIEYYKVRAKALERTPSMSSRPSRRSLTQGSLIQAATTGLRREKDEILAIENGRDSREYCRRPSQIDDDERENLRAASKHPSRQASRNTSTGRQPSDELPTRPRAPSHRSSVDYSQRDEPVM